MTLVVVLKGKNGVVLAADSRGIIGDPRGLTAINDNYDKLFRLTKYSAVTSFGAAELSAQIMEIVTKHQSIKNLENEMNIDKIIETFRKLVCKIYTEWFKQTPPHQRPIVGYIFGGITEDNKAKVFTLVSALEFAPQYHIKGVGMGGVPQYATYLAHKLYNEKLTYTKLANLAVFLISETATQDPKVGGPIKLASVTPEKGFVFFTENKVKNIIEQNDNINNKLKELFNKGV